NGEIQRNGTDIKAKSNGLVGKILINNDSDTVTIDGVTMTLREAFLL
ncbi:MAG: hypothetical protein HZA82_05945, partial [Thaumarchaeota archaeon]|nr:hypothetical protein [Nitrososphaerota archaeon]